MNETMQAEICFEGPEQMNAAMPALAALGFEIDVLDWTYPCGTPAVWIKAKIDTELDDSRFFDWINGIVGPLGFVVEAGLSTPTHV